MARWGSRRRWPVLGCLTGFGTVAAVLALSQPLLLPLIGGFLIVADPLEPAEAVVPLAGDPGRIVQATELFDEGYARSLIVTNMRVEGADNPTWYAEWAKDIAAQEGADRERILVVPTVVASTHEEAVAIRDFARDHGLRSLIVVTDPYHTRRSQIILCDVFRGTGISVAIRPVERHPYSPHSWWQSEEGVQTTALEYFKLLVYLLAFRSNGSIVILG